MQYVLRNYEIFQQESRKQLVVALWKQERNVLSMVYDVLLHTARLESNGTRRLFMVYEEGKRQPKTVFKNEYGFDAGVINPAVAESDFGTITLYEKSYYYNLNCQSSGVLSVYDNPAEEPLISFAMEVATVNTLATIAANRLPADYFNCLLMAVCWYLQLPARPVELMNTGFMQQKNEMIRT